MSQAQFWGRKTFCVITGASQGIGRQVSIDFSRNMGEKSVMLLLARSIPGMVETQRLVLETNPSVNVAFCSADLMKPNSEDFTHFIKSTLTKFNVQPNDFDLAMIVHNAGSVGDVTEKASEMLDHQKLVDYLSLNVVSVTCLNSVFLELFPKDTVKEISIVNITSLCGIKPFKSMGYYCIGKASREMFFKVLAEESPWLNVLSYSPGPVETDMLTQVIDNVADADIRKQFIENKGKNLTPEQTTKRCIKVLAARNYKSGGRVDYFDDE